MFSFVVCVCWLERVQQSGIAGIQAHTHSLTPSTTRKDTHRSIGRSAHHGNVDLRWSLPMLHATYTHTPPDVRTKLQFHSATKWSPPRCTRPRVFFSPLFSHSPSPSSATTRDARTALLGGFECDEEGVASHKYTRTRSRSQAGPSAARWATADLPHTAPRKSLR